MKLWHFIASLRKLKVGTLYRIMNAVVLVFSPLLHFGERKLKENKHLVLDWELLNGMSALIWCLNPPSPLLGCDINLLVYFTGTGFPRDAQSLQVTVNQTRCEVIFSNETNVVCELDLLPVGVHRILMLVRPSGLAVNASGEGLLLYVEPRLDAVEPAAVAEIGNVGGHPLCTCSLKWQFLFICANPGPKHDIFYMYWDLQLFVSYTFPQVKTFLSSEMNLLGTLRREFGWWGDTLDHGVTWMVIQLKNSKMINEILLVLGKMWLAWGFIGKGWSQGTKRSAGCQHSHVLCTRLPCL